MSVVKPHFGGSDLARSIVAASIVAASIVAASIVAGLAVFSCGAFAAQPPGPAPPPVPAPPPAAGQPAPAAAKKPYIVDPVDENLKNDQRTISAIRRGLTFSAGQQEAFDRYYEGYALARWSVPEDAAAVEAFRRELKRDLVNPTTGAVRDHLNSLVLAFMNVRATTYYHPVTRVNAMLMIGELNSAVPPGFGVPPAPLPDALPVMVQAVQDAQQPDAVKVAALGGILRHLELDGVKAPDRVALVGATALATIGSAQQPRQSTDAHAWLRKLGAEVLGELAVVGAAGEEANALAAMVGDPATPFYARCSAAEASGKLNYAGATGLDASKLASPLARLVVDACTAEEKAREEAEAKAKTQAQPGVLGPGGFPIAQPPPGFGGPLGGRPGAPPPEPIPPMFRNRLKYRANAALVGLNGPLDKPGGVAPLATGTPHEKFVAALQGHVQAILDLIEATRSDDPAELKVMMAKVIGEADKIRALLPSNQPP